MTKKYTDFVKNIKKLDESLEEDVSIPCCIAPGDIVHLSKFAEQLSAAFQPKISKVLERVETELNKFGYSLGELEPQGQTEDEGMEDFIVYNYATEEEVRNLFLTLKWKNIGSKIYDYKTDKLEYSVTLTLNEIDPEDFDTLFTDEELEFIDEYQSDDEDDADGEEYIGEDTSYDDYVKEMIKKHDFDIENASPIEKAKFFKKIDGGYNSKEEPGKDGLKEQVDNLVQFKRDLKKLKDSELKQRLKYYREKDERKYDAIVTEMDFRGLAESVEELNETFVFKTSGRQFSAKDQDTKFVFSVTSSGGLTFLMVDDAGRESALSIPQNQVDDFMVKLMDHYIQNKK